ncbi:major facilitator superfamily domain-containing protein [Diplogelasinospora grovesii]|uniref:Major facilitator superfamily domain-containing protein n=1 Tax=Diplogelasinospora grovesii TaxID=303347 RepID=A0AAN6N296_9PEZI|nr:major facilitator superfamily domain-containing protein [Diplogelasinospora grovesii]
MTSDVIHSVDSTHPLHEKKGAIPSGSVPSITNSNSPEPIEIDAAVEKRIRRKLDRVVVTLVFLSYLAAFLDRSNIGNAETAGMSKDLGFDDAHYQWLLTIFYIPYIVFEWFAIMWKIIPPHIWAGVTVLTWGLASTLQAAAFNWEGLMVCRWFLAMAETGFAPGVPYLLSFFYRRHELGLRCGIFLSAAPLATTFAGALAFGITSGYPSMANWRLLFLVEGLPCLVLAVAIFYLLPDSPDTAKFLTPEEKEVAKARAIAQSGKEGKDRLGGFEWKEALAAFKQPQTLIQPMMYFSCNVSFASLPVFLPAILTTMGYSNINAQGLTAPPYFLSFLVCIGTTYLADRTRQRGLIIMALSLMGGVGYVLLATVQSVGVRYLGVFLAAAGVFPAIANILSWVLNNQGTDTKRGVGITMLNIIGQCGPLLGTRIFPVTDRPYYVKGMAICAAFMFFNAFLAAVLRTYFVIQNKKLEKAEQEAATAAAAQGYEAKTGPIGETEIEGTFGYRYML